MTNQYQPTKYIKRILHRNYSYNRSDTNHKATHFGLKGIYTARWNDNGTITYSFREYEPFGNYINGSK